MKKRILCAILVCSMLFSCAGCSSYLNGDYFYINDYTEESDSGVDISTGIKNYNGLKRAIVALVTRHEEEGSLQFRNYNGNISEDLAEACWEVKSTTPLGAYSVDYISYDLSRIVSYYEADVYITYKRTKEQIASIVSIGTSISVKMPLQTGMSTMEPYLAISMSTTIMDEETIRDEITKIYYSNPLCCIALPNTKVSIYPDSGVQKIFEINFDYCGLETQQLVNMKSQLTDTAADWLADIENERDEDNIYQIGMALTRRCQYDPTLSTERLSGLPQELGSTAYGAIVENQADSEGFAMAFAALCIGAGIDCTVVRGRLNNNEHFWNIVKIDKEYYHLDCSVWQLNGYYQTYLKSDADMLSSYWWDTSAYPECESSYIITSSTPEPSPEASPAAESGQTA